MAVEQSTFDTILKEVKRWASIVEKTAEHIIESGKEDDRNKAK